MNDLHLPDENPLTDLQRARLRSGLLATIDEPRRKSWLLPLTAAAAVVAVAGTVGYAVGAGDSDTPRNNDPAGTVVETSVAPPVVDPTPQPQQDADYTVERRGDVLIIRNRDGQVVKRIKNARNVKPPLILKVENGKVVLPSLPDLPKEQLKDKP